MALRKYRKALRYLDLCWEKDGIDEESGIMHYDLMLSCRPSPIAVAAVYGALRALNHTPCWTETLQHYTGFANHEIKRCADKRTSLHLGLNKSNLRAVYRKFTDPSKGTVALLPLKPVSAQEEEQT